MEGSYDAKTNTITLDIDQLKRRSGETVKGAILRVASHELTHFIQERSQSDYRALKNFCVSEILKLHSQEEIDYRKEQIIQANKKAGTQLTSREAMDELIANACEQMLQRSDILNELYKKNATLGEKVSDFFRDFLTKIKENLGNGTRSREAQWIENAIDDIQEIWEKGLRNAAKNQIALNGIKNTASEGGGKLSTAMYDSENVYEFEKAITIRDIKILQAIGRKSINQFTSEDLKAAQKWAYKFQQELGTKSPFFRAWFGEWRAYQTSDIVTIADIPDYVASNEARKDNRGGFKNNDTGWTIRVSREGETNTISHAGEAKLSEYGLAGIRSLLENAYLFNSEVHEHHKNNPANDLIAFDHKLYALGKDVNGNIGLYRITVEDYYQNKFETSNKKFHNLKYIEKVAELSADALAGKTSSGGSTSDNSTTVFSISDLYEFVNKYDLN